ncbi:MAG TPA: sigma-70 family RNA polymerase sigma factor [Anaerolineaceae bacterium]|nr:sigma-70 family RNA polymerase sigma factor [Anaerolineaceae bacterium]
MDGQTNSVSFDDARLLSLIGEGSSGALSEFYDRYSRLVYSLAYQMVGNTGIAEEITQDVFFQVWQKSQTYRREQGKIITWLAGITRHRSIDVLRRQNVRPEGHQAEWADGFSDDWEDDTRLESAVELNLEKKRVREAIAQLPMEQRKVLALAYFNGYSHQEIVDLTGEPLGTVKTRLRLAMHKLRQYFSDEPISSEEI